MTVRQLADRYGVSTGFVVQALGKIGFNALTLDTDVTTAAASAFEAEFGGKIRARRPEPAPAFTVESDVSPPPITARNGFTTKPHVMRVAHERVGAGRDAAGNREKRLVSDPGLVHAMDLVGTWVSDPWRGEVVPGAVHFFGGAMNTGPRAACGRMHMRAVLGTEFVPADEPAKAGQCPKCAELVAEGKGFRSPPGSYDPFCHAFLHVKINGQVEVQDCKLSGEHRGLHRTRDGATWDIGFDDFVPAPLDAGCRITKAS